MARLPNPGSDEGTWGDILNEFLGQIHTSDGQLKADSVGPSQIQDNAVTSDQIAPGAVTPTAVDDNSIPQSKITNLTTDLAGKQAAGDYATNAALTNGLAGKQDADGDLTAIAGLSPSNDDIIQRKAGVWTNRTPVQLKTDLTLTKSDVGLGSVDNTSDASKNSAVATLSNKTIQKRVVALTDGATITPDGDTTDIATVTLGGNRTMAAPTGTPLDGQSLIFRIKQDATGTRTITWNAIYRFAFGLAPTLTTTASKTDYIGFQYNAADAKWDCLAERLNI